VAAESLAALEQVFQLKPLEQLGLVQLGLEQLEQVLELEFALELAL